MKEIGGPHSPASSLPDLALAGQSGSGAGVLWCGLITSPAPQLWQCPTQPGGMRLEGQTWCPCHQLSLLAVLMAGQPLLRAGITQDGGQCLSPAASLLLPAAGMLPCPVYGEWPHTLSPTKAKAPWPGCCGGDLGARVGDLVVPLVTYNLLPCFQALQELAAQHPSIKLVQLGMEQSPSLHPTLLLALRSLQGRDREQLFWAASLYTGSQSALALPGGEGAVHIWAGVPLQAELPTGWKQSNWLQRQAEVGLDTSAEQVSWERYDLCSQRC